MLVWRVLHAATISRDRLGCAHRGRGGDDADVPRAHKHQMAMGMMPVTGLPLPFVNYGRSNLLVSMMSVGLVQAS